MIDGLDKALLSALELKGNVATSRQIYSQIGKVFSERTLQNHLQKLKSLGIITIEGCKAKGGRAEPA